MRISDWSSDVCSSDLALVPFDSPHRGRLIAAAGPHAGTILTFGLGEGADLRAREAMVMSGAGTLVTAILPDSEITFTLSPPGDHWVSNALAVLGDVPTLGGAHAPAGPAHPALTGLQGRGGHPRTVGAGGAAL